MSTFRAVPAPLRPLALPLLLACAAGCRAPQELDPVARLPKVPGIERESQRPKLCVVVDESLPDDVLPEGLMARSIGDRDPRPIDRLLRTFEVALEETEHFELVPEDQADYRFDFTVQEIHVDDREEIGPIDWFSYKFFGLYLVATARLGGALYDTRSGEQVGANLERRGQYRILEGKAFRSYQDPYLDLLGMGTSFTKTGEPAVANAVQKAIVKLIADIARGTEEQEQTGRARQKNADE